MEKELAKLEAAVARSLAMGLIDVPQVSAEIKTKIEHMIRFFEENF